MEKGRWKESKKERTKGKKEKGKKGDDKKVVVKGAKKRLGSSGDGWKKSNRRRSGKNLGSSRSSCPLARSLLESTS